MSENNKAYQQQGAHACGFQNVHEVRKAGVSPHASVKIEKIENESLDDQDDGRNRSNTENWLSGMSKLNRRRFARYQDTERR